MVPLIKSLFAKTGTEFVSKTMEGLDNLITSDEERLKIESQMKKQFQEFSEKLIGVVETEENNRTERHTADMASDSKLAKNIRPLSLIFILLLYTAFSILEGRDWLHINQAFVSLLGEWGMMIMSFYFGGRSLEKVAGIISAGGSTQGGSVQEKVTGLFGRRKNKSEAVG